MVIEGKRKNAELLVESEKIQDKKQNELNFFYLNYR
jgi:hypothetical protein